MIYLIRKWQKNRQIVLKKKNAKLNIMMHLNQTLNKKSDAVKSQQYVKKKLPEKNRTYTTTNVGSPKT